LFSPAPFLFTEITAIISGTQENTAKLHFSQTMDSHLPHCCRAIEIFSAIMERNTLALERIATALESRPTFSFNDENATTMQSTKTMKPGEIPPPSAKRAPTFADIVSRPNAVIYDQEKREPPHATSRLLTIVLGGSSSLDDVPNLIALFAGETVPISSVRPLGKTSSGGLGLVLVALETEESAWKIIDGRHRSHYFPELSDCWVRQDRLNPLPTKKCQLQFQKTRLPKLSKVVNDKLTSSKRSTAFDGEDHAEQSSADIVTLTRQPKTNIETEPPTANETTVNERTVNDDDNETGPPVIIVDDKESDPPTDMQAETSAYNDIVEETLSCHRCVTDHTISLHKTMLEELLRRFLTTM
jgi:hypothetical protein